MPNGNPAKIIVFDVNETLLDITTLEPLFAKLFDDASILREWFAELILYSQSMTLSGLYTPFGELAAGVLRMVGSNNGISVSDKDIAELKDLLDNMPAHADVIPALTRLGEEGFRMVTLTNSTGSSSPTALEKAGIDRFFERYFSVEAVGKFKPAAETYQHLAKELNADMADLCLVACHLWDIIGAQSAGGAGAFLTRPHNSLLMAKNVPTPDIVGSDLADLTEQIIQSFGRN